MPDEALAGRGLAGWAGSPRPVPVKPRDLTRGPGVGILYRPSIRMSMGNKSYPGYSASGGPAARRPGRTS
ncbi:hypothetical protein FRACA_570003 [Frankia canadensis]|uniref:Uncharacterized protein n=1 Tax=Frankia canadensis TaxID=1836972 RepID=A0A2I2KZ35_9ACTN|nr:hypothetical protein FRACA_570003 [Frankia canadensis]SOU58209.1 hypothetical protein FRACA_570003 [Frankia canadensis]